MDTGNGNDMAKAMAMAMAMAMDTGYCRILDLKSSSTNDTKESTSHQNELPNKVIKQNS